MSSQPTSFLTPEQYLEIERAAEFKSEYWNGEMYAMSGARLAHNLIGVNVTAALHGQLRSRPCQNYSSDMRVRTSSDLYTYPDIVAVCGEPQLLDGTLDTLLNAALIGEILSPSTERYDRGFKFEQYRTIESLREYLLLASDRIHAELFTKDDTGQWRFAAWSSPEDVVHLESIDCHLKLADVYEKVVFAETSGLPRSREPR